MPVEQHNYVTKDEVESSYEYKLIKRILKREYPWIIDIRVPSDEEINQYNLIFLDVFVDPFILQKQTGWPMVSYLRYYLDKRLGHHLPNTYETSYLATMFNVDREQTQDIQADVEKTMKSVSTSNAIPEDLKIRKGRSFVVGSWIIPEIKEIPSDAVFTERNRTF
jgi:hypothetical protein